MAGAKSEVSAVVDVVTVFVYIYNDVGPLT